MPPALAGSGRRRPAAGAARRERSAAERSQVKDARTLARRLARGARAAPGRPTARAPARRARARRGRGSPSPPSTIDSVRPPTASATLGVRAERGLHHGERPALGGRGGHVDPGAARTARPCVRRRRSRACEPDRQAAARDLGLDVRAVVALSDHVEGCARHSVEHVEERLHALVRLQPSDEDQARLGRALARAELLGLHAEVLDRDVLARDPLAHQVVARRVRDREEGRAPVEQAQRPALEQPEQRAAGARELL